MLIFFELSLAIKYLRQNAGFGILPVFALIGMFLGVATLISVMSVMNGFREELTQNVMGIDGHVEVNVFHEPLSRLNEISSKILSINYVERVFKITENPAMIRYNEDSSAVIVRGINSKNIKQKFSLSHFQLIDGNLSSFKDGILVGSKLADKLQLKIGSRLKIFSTEGFSTFIGTLPRVSTHKVIGIFHVNVFEYDEVLVIMPLNLAQKIFMYRNSSISKFEIFLKDPLFSELFVSELRKSKINSISWKSKQGYLLRALNIEKNVMFFILSMIILVASFSIISSIICLVEGKKSAIAIMRTLGMTKFAVMRIFCFCGVILGICGITLGCLAGILFSLNINNIKTFIERVFNVTLFDSVVYFLDSLPSVLLISDVIYVVFIALLLCIFGSVISSWKAAGYEPSIILKAE